MSPSNLSPLLDISPPTITTTPCNTTESSIAGGQENKPLDRKKNEMKENLLVLEVQISSASGELQKLKAEQDELTPLAAIRGRICITDVIKAVTQKPPVNPVRVRAATTARFEKNTPR